MVGKFIYLIIPIPYLSFIVGVVSQFMQTPRIDHWNVVLCIKDTSKNLQDNVYFMKTKRIRKSWNIDMLIVPSW